MEERSAIDCSNYTAERGMKGGARKGGGELQFQSEETGTPREGSYV